MNYDNKTGLPELLSPAGSFAHMKAAFSAGADAVYLGGHKFGARAYADNFSSEELKEALHYAHFYDKSIYMTVNILMKENEIQKELYHYLAPLYEAGLDGVIVQDPGVCAFVRKYFPGMEIHASTQMTITDPAGVRALKRMGICRLVPARELSLQELKKIKEEGLELEVFIHGALCVSYSGQCLMSSIYGGRSGNRGRCAQPCRLPYRAWREEDGTLYPLSSDRRSCPLSPKDLCGLELLPDLVEAGIDSLKIEGRMKNVEYVAGLTAIYRKYLDRIGRLQTGEGSYQVDPEDLGLLEDLYVRGSFNRGYFYQKNGQDMMAAHSPKNTGRKIGKILSARGSKVLIDSNTALHPRDLLVIPLKGRDRDGQEEVLLTVPDQIPKNREGYISLQLPVIRDGRKPGPGMPVYRRFNRLLSDRIRDQIQAREEKLPVRAEISVRKDRPSRLSLTCGDYAVTETGKRGQESCNHPLSDRDVKRQLAKTGNVPFFLESLDMDLDKNVFLPMSELKSMRQRAYERLRQLKQASRDRKPGPAYDKMEGGGNLERPDRGLIDREDERPAGRSREGFDGKSAGRSREKFDGRNPEKSAEGAGGKKIKSANVYKKEIVEYILEKGYFDEICLSMDYMGRSDLLKMAGLCDKAGCPVSLSLPRILRESGSLNPFILTAFPWKRFVVHNLNEAQYLYEVLPQASLSAGMSFYQWNTQAVDEMERLYPVLDIRTLPVELSAEEEKDLVFYGRQEAEILIYGRVPLMITAQCLKMTNGCCDHRPELLFLERKDGLILPVTTHCDACRNLIWQDKPRDLIGEGSGLCKRIKRHLFDLFYMDIPEIDRTMRRYISWEERNFKPGRAVKADRKWTMGTE